MGTLMEPRMILFYTLFQRIYKTPLVIAFIVGTGLTFVNVLQKII